MTSASPASLGRNTAAASAGTRSRADLTALRSRCSRSSDATISSLASCNRRRRSRLAIRVEGGTRYAKSPARRAGYRSTREDDLDDVTADLAGHRFGEVARGLCSERGLYPTHAAAVSREIEHHLRYAGVILEDFLDLLEKRDGSLVVQDLPESNDERGRLFHLGTVPRWRRERRLSTGPLCAIP